MKIGVFGGYFNPIHQGHISNCLNVKKAFNLDKLYVVPTLKPVHKTGNKKMLNQDRYLMVESFFSHLSPDIIVDDFEFKSGKPNYTIYTLEKFKKDFPKDELYLILGVDQFLHIDSWKDIEKILDLSHMVVVKRPPYPWPIEKDQLPEVIKNLSSDFRDSQIKLKTDKKIHFYKSSEMAISSFEIRNQIQSGKKPEKITPKEVIETIVEKKLYTEKKDLKNNYEELAYFVANIIKDKQGYDIGGWNFTKTDYFSDFVIIASAKNKTHCNALSDYVTELVKEKYQIKPKSLEGLKSGEWVIIDYKGLVIHLFYDYIRKKYQLEELLKEGSPLLFHTI